MLLKRSNPEQSQRPPLCSDGAQSSRWSPPEKAKLLDASATFEDSEASATPGASDASRRRVPVNDTSSLAATLLTRWGEGQLSAIDVQQFAQAAVQDGATHPEVTWLAQLGSHGLYPGSASRDLKAKYLQETLAPEPYSAKVSLFTTKDRTATFEQNVDLLLPHEWFAKLASSFGPWDFDEQFGAALAPEWWTGCPRFEQSEVLRASITGHR